MTTERDDVGLYEGLVTTRAIRRYRDEPIPETDLRDILFAATRAPSGSNRQPFRFVVLTSGPVAQEAKRLIGEGARRFWGTKRATDGYDRGSGTREDSPKARVARTMQEYVDTYETVPAVVLACFVPYRAPSPADGASVYPACQNLLLAARALGYGGVMTGWHYAVEPRTAPPSPDTRGCRDLRHHHPRAPGGPSRSGPPTPPSRADLRRQMGRSPCLGRGSGRSGPRGSGSPVQA
jgi:nitroreductase